MGCDDEGRAVAQCCDNLRSYMVTSESAHGGVAAVLSDAVPQDGQRPCARLGGC